MPRQQALFFDGTRLTCEMVDIAFVRLQRGLVRMTNRPRLPRQALATALTDAWGLLDSLERLRRLVPHLPGVKKQKAAPVARFMRLASDVEKLRHAVQHIDRESHECLASKTPALGVLSWCLVDDSGTTIQSASIVSGSLLTGVYPVTNPAGKPVQSRLDHVSLRLSRYSVDLSAAYRAVAALVHHLERGLARVPPGATLGSDTLVRAVFGPSNSNSA